MKNTIILLALVISTFTSFAQIKSVDEINDGMSEGINRGFKVLIPEASKKDVIKGWEKLMKSYGGTVDKVKKTEDYKGTDVTMPSVSEQAVTTYSLFQETPRGVYMKTSVNMGSSYLNSESYANEVPAYKTIVKAFATNTARAAVEEKLKEATKSLQKLEKELKTLEKGQENGEKTIKNAQETIAETQKYLEVNAPDQTSKSAEIDKQKQVTDAIEALLKRY